MTKTVPSPRDAKAGRAAADDRLLRLTAILKRLNDGGDPAAASEEAREFLASVSPTDLARAEQALLDDGWTPHELRHLCAIHLQVAGDQRQAMKGKLAPGHILRTMLEEHEVILGVVDELAAVSRAIQAMDRYDGRRGELAGLVRVARQLAATDGHHRREEEVLFLELERWGISAPGRILGTQHAELRTYTRALLEMAEGVGHMDFDEFKNRLNVTTALISVTLRDHILTEDNILYPTALEVIDDEQVWDRMNEASYRIGAGSLASEA